MNAMHDIDRLSAALPCAHRSPASHTAAIAPQRGDSTSAHATQRLAQLVAPELPLPPQPQRSRLSEATLRMLAAAMQHPDPTLAALGIEAFVFNINGFKASNMVWLRDGNGRVVLCTPQDQRWPVRQYPDLGAMKDAIIHMLNVEHGRDMIARHFDMPDATYAWGWSLSTWLVQIPRHPGTYEYAIADYYRTPASDATLKLALPSPQWLDDTDVGTRMPQEA